MVRSSVFPAVLRSFQKGGRAAAALGALTLAFLVIAPVAGAQEKSALEKIQQRGMLTVALYKDFAPFSDNGRGIDVDLAEALATKPVSYTHLTLPTIYSV